MLTVSYQLSTVSAVTQTILNQAPSALKLRIPFVFSGLSAAAVVLYSDSMLVRRHISEATQDCHCLALTKDTYLSASPNR